jgi:hypothetical protein
MFWVGMVEDGDGPSSRQCITGSHCCCIPREVGEADSDFFVFFSAMQLIVCAANIQESLRH